MRAMKKPAGREAVALELVDDRLRVGRAALQIIGGAAGEALNVHGKNPRGEISNERMFHTSVSNVVSDD